VTESSDERQLEDEETWVQRRRGMGTLTELPYSCKRPANQGQWRSEFVRKRTEDKERNRKQKGGEKTAGKF